jgi:uncharacterized protein (TIGR02246 family)
MKSKLIMPAFIGLSVVLFACDRVASHDEDEGNAAAHSDPKADADAVKKVEQEMLAGFKAKDAAKVTSYYADDAVVAMPGQDAVSGRDGISKAIANDMKDSAFSIDFANQDAQASGDLAYTRGTFNVTFTDPGTKKKGTMSGNYVTVFRRQADGSWKAVADYATPGAGKGG